MQLQPWALLWFKFSALHMQGHPVESGTWEAFWFVRIVHIIMAGAEIPRSISASKGCPNYIWEEMGTRRFIQQNELECGNQGCYSKRGLCFRFCLFSYFRFYGQCDSQSPPIYSNKPRLRTLCFAFSLSIPISVKYASGNIFSLPQYAAYYTHTVEKHSGSWASLRCTSRRLIKISGVFEESRDV